MFCRKCGKEIVEGGRFCVCCGEKVELAAQAAPCYIGQSPQRESLRTPVPQKAPAANNSDNGAKPKKKKKWIIISAIAGSLVVAALLAVILLNGALINTGGNSYRYFGTLRELVDENPDIISRIYNEELIITCNDYEIREMGGIDDSVSNITRFSTGLSEQSDRFMEMEMMVTRSSDGWKFVFEDYSDVYWWVECLLA